MAVLKNRAKMSTSTTGTGTITLGSAESGYQTFADAGVADADVVRYVIEDGAAWEIGTGTYTATGTTLTRTVSESSNADAAIVLTGSAVVFVGAAAEDIYTDADVDTHLNTGTATTGEVLSWSGTDYDWIAAGGGGSPDLFAESYDGTSGLPVATGSTNAVAVGRAYASGTDSFAAAIARNTASYGAQGANSVAMGDRAKSTGSRSFSLGRLSTATNTRSITIGDSADSTGDSSVSIGYTAQALNHYSVALGYKSSAIIRGKYAYAGGAFAASGDSQSGTLILRSDTTDATAEALTSGGSASTDNQVALPNNSVYGFTGTIIARENSAQTNDFAVWEVKGGAVRAASAATTALGSYNINKISESTGAAAWAIAISADTTNGAIAFTVTGEASHSIRWVATINTTEVTY